MTNKRTYSRLLLTSLMTLCSFIGHSQLSETQVFQKIASFQVVEDEFYDAGLFPSQRSWGFFSKPAEDNTIFFTASIATTIRMIQHRLDSVNRQTASSIIHNAEANYSKYASRNGEGTYNFWQTVPPDLPFPNGSKLISNKKGRLPDDFNSTVLIALASQRNDSSDQLIRKKMTAYSKRENRHLVSLNTLDAYKNSEAYEVWFGKNMPQAFDICVMSNVLLYVLDRGFELNQYDLETISLIKRMIRNDHHLKQSAEISHHSDSPALILYHVARLISLDNQGLFDDIETKVINDLRKLEGEVENELEKVMILSSLKRLSQNVDLSTLDHEKLNADVTSFSFFSIDPYNISMGIYKFLPTIRWISEAYNWTLYLELLVLVNESN